MGKPPGQRERFHQGRGGRVVGAVTSNTSWSASSPVKTSLHRIYCVSETMLHQFASSIKSGQEPKNSGFTNLSSMPCSDLGCWVYYEDTLPSTPNRSSTDPAYLVAAAVQSLIHPLPAGTAFCIGVVLIVMMTGRFVQTQGSLTRAVLPFVVSLRWGWHRVERAMERGAFSLDAMCDRASDWCLAPLPLDPVRLGRGTARSTPSTRRPLPVSGRASAWPWQAKATAIERAGPGGPISWPL